ncbi:protein preli-like [Ctenocephalides felis]|uniref:protein preli-like n=1 Tax=Ctenocephalides felis TaxID=7515 RepID=UPI000E6E2840|nr:protein preli-like [Ctenocephalides felis]
MSKAKYFENTTVFNFKWDQVAKAFWLRYPNPHSSHVLSEDTITRDVKEGRLHTRRLLTKTNLVPKWGKKFISAPFVKIYEESIVDPLNKTMITYTFNMGHAKVMSVIEKVVYKVSTDNPNHTIAVRSAWIDSQVFGFSRAIKGFGLERFRHNWSKAIVGYNYILNKMFAPHNYITEDALNHNNANSNINIIKEVARNATDKAKARADDIYLMAKSRSTQEQIP